MTKSRVFRFLRLAAFTLLATFLTAAPAFAQTTSAPSPWPWYLTRAAGLTSLILMFSLVSLGICITSGLAYRVMSPLVTWTIHRLIGITLSITIAIHIVSLLLDRYVSFSAAEVFIPFASTFRPLYMSAGIIGFYIFAIILATSLWMIISHYHTWRFIHYLSYAAVVLILFHGFYTGTDTANPIIKVMYWLMSVILVILTLYRVMKFRTRPDTFIPGLDSK